MPARRARVDFAAHARALGAMPRKSPASPSWRRRCRAREGSDRTYVIVIDTDPLVTTQEGGAWWDVAVPETSAPREVRAARQAYEQALERQKLA